SIGLFFEFLKDTDVKMVGIEAGGRGNTLGEHAARLAAHQGFTGARPGVLQGTYTYVLQNEDGQLAAPHSISAGLEYPAIGPEHAWLADQHRAEYAAVDDQAALDAAQLLSRTEGIISALGCAHRGHYSRARIRARHRRPHRAPPTTEVQRPDNRQSLWPRRQGHGHV